MIHKHNLEFDIGIHSYTLEINQFGDMVNTKRRKKSFFHNLVFLFSVKRQMKNFENK